MSLRSNESTKVVDDHSARLDDGRERWDTITSNHMDMCRFPSPQDSGYVKVTEALKDILEWKSIRAIENPVAVDRFQQPQRSIRVDPAAIGAQREENLKKRLLHSLDDEETRMRYEQVETAIKTTFKWIFENKTIRFKEWLESGRGIFWIKGKPASGKSTLMRFVLDSPQTKNALHGYTMASCFFHGRGTAFQKSFEGLLKGIIFKLLSEIPELQDVVLPIYRAALLRSSEIEWTFERLNHAFRDIARQALHPVQICLFIDALDEYDGKEEALIKFLQQIAVSSTTSQTHIKACVSSRPLQVFLDRFSACPGFSLQDYTKRDIKTMINSRLREDDRMRTYLDSTGNSEEMREQLNRLVSQLEDRAEGVFLWVRLVLDDDLLSAFSGRTSIEGLFKLLDFLPDDLQDLFQTIYDRIPEHDRAETNRLLAVLNSTGTKLTVFNLIFIARVGVAKPLIEASSLVASLSSISLDEGERILRRRCSNLIEYAMTSWDDCSVHGLHFFGAFGICRGNLCACSNRHGAIRDRVPGSSTCRIAEMGYILRTRPYKDTLMTRVRLIHQTARQFVSGIKMTANNYADGDVLIIKALIAFYKCRHQLRERIDAYGISGACSYDEKDREEYDIETDLRKMFAIHLIRANRMSKIDNSFFSFINEVDPSIIQSITDTRISRPNFYTVKSVLSLSAYLGLDKLILEAPQGEDANAQNIAIAGSTEPLLSLALTAAYSLNDFSSIVQTINKLLRAGASLDVKGIQLEPNFENFDPRIRYHDALHVNFSNIFHFLHFYFKFGKYLEYLERSVLLTKALIAEGRYRDVDVRLFLCQSPSENVLFPLHLACLVGVCTNNFSLFELLLRHKASANKLSSSGKTALDDLIEPCRDYNSHQEMAYVDHELSPQAEGLDDSNERGYSECGLPLPTKYPYHDRHDLLESSRPLCKCYKLKGHIASSIASIEAGENQSIFSNPKLGRVNDRFRVISQFLDYGAKIGNCLETTVPFEKTEFPESLRESLERLSSIGVYVDYRIFDLPEINFTWGEDGHPVPQEDLDDNGESGVIEDGLEVDEARTEEELGDVDGQSFLVTSKSALIRMLQYLPSVG